MNKNKLLFHCFLVFILVFVFIEAKAYDVNYAGCYKSVTLNFETVDENNNPITISELVTYPLEKDGVTKRKVGFFVLSSMPFAVKEEQTATGSSPLDATALRTIATEGAMCVQLDYQGFGASSSHACKPFLNNKLNARQSIDGLFAAMKYAEENGITISDDYYTINCGYSLAGGRAIAVQQYLEKYSSKEDKAKFRLRKTICGGAPLNGTATLKYALKTWLNKNGNFSVIKGFILSKAQGALHRYVASDGTILKDSILSVVDGDTTVCADVINGTSYAGKAVWKAISQENLDEDWIPETPITYLHWTGDSTVTYENAEIALKAWGKDKFNIVDKDMTNKKWNVSLLSVLREATNKYITTDPHFNGATNFYTGMVDGCLRDTTITGVYGADMNYYKMLAVLFDISANLKKTVKLDFSLFKGYDINFSVNTLSNLRIDAKINNLQYTIKLAPELKDSLSSQISDVDGKGFLHLPVVIEVAYGMAAKVTCPDFYQFVEALTATVMHHKCATEGEALKYCNSVNKTMTAKTPFGFLIAWYHYSDSMKAYLIEPYLRKKVTGGDTIYYSLDQIQDSTALGDLLPAGVHLRDFIYKDGKTISFFGHPVKFRDIIDETNHQAINAEIMAKDSTSVIANVNLDIKGIDRNEDGTLQELEVGFSVLALDGRVKVDGHCKNISDAILSGILCYGNLSCETEAQAQMYADAVNNNLDKLELYVQKVNDDDTYSETPVFIDYGPGHAIIVQDANGAYHVQFCFNWMGQKNVPLNVIINTLLKS